jgi:hypothetical protein
MGSEKEQADRTVFTGATGTMSCLLQCVFKLALYLHPYVKMKYDERLFFKKE